jgi:rod shape-determining protein MreD
VRRTLVIFLAQYLLWALVTQLNHALSGAHVYLFVGGLVIAYAALALPLRDGLAASVLAGLLCDAGTAAGFGTHTLLFAAGHTIVFNLRDRIPRDETAGRVIVALLTNLGLFLLFSFLQISRLPAPAAVWPRLIADLMCSQVFLALVAPWFFALQARALVLAGAERELPV